MKLKVYRASGMPVLDGNIEKFTAEYNAFYDKAQAKYLPSTGKLPTAAEAEPLQKLLKKFEKRLKRKYPETDDWDLLKTKKQWVQKIKELQFPIALAVNPETNDLMYVILDVEF